MPTQSTLTLSDDLHVTIKMMAAARRTSLSTLVADLLLEGVSQTLREDPDLAGLIRSLVERDENMDRKLRQDVLRLLDRLAAR
jgi:hypothetical protein